MGAVSDSSVKLARAKEADAIRSGLAEVKAEAIRKYHPRLVISTEEAPEDPAAIRNAVLEIDSSYRFRCGPCLLREREVRNDTVFFQ